MSEPQLSIGDQITYKAHTGRRSRVTVEAIIQPGEVFPDLGGRYTGKYKVGSVNKSPNAKYILKQRRLTADGSPAKPGVIVAPVPTLDKQQAGVDCDAI